MKRDRLFGNGLMRLAAYALAAFACASGVQAQNIRSGTVNPAFKQWQKERRYKRNVNVPGTNVVRQTNCRKLAATNPTNAIEPTFGLAPEMFDTSYLANLNIDALRGIQDPLPKKHDPREGESLPPIRNQSPYGTCWAHAACASLEIGLTSDSIGEFDFSEKNMALSHGFDWDFEKGGNGDMASAYLLRWDGPVLESQDPYPDRTYYDTWFYDNHDWNEVKKKWIQKDPLKYSINTILPPSPNIAPARHVQNIRWVSQRTSYLDNDGIKDAILNYGTLWVGYNHETNYYNSANAAYYFNGNISRSMNHAVALVGWDDEYPAKNFASTPPGNGAFIVRNSWGASWGDGGYFYVSYYDESFAWKRLYAFSLAENPDNYEAIYQYDPLGVLGNVGFDKSSMAWGANIFTATNTTRVAAVGFYALTPNTAFTIKIYKSPEPNDPTTGTLGTTQSGKTSSAGFFTIPLNAPQSVTARQRFSVVLQLTTPGTYPIAYEYADPGYTSDATASAGQSFISTDGKRDNWLDLTDWNGSANVCIKAYTKSATIAKPTLISITVMPEDGKTASIKPGDTVQMKCEATYSNNAQSNVTAAARWSLASGRNYATLSSEGLLSAKNVTVLEPQTITAQAIYSEDGITVTNKFGFSLAATAPSAPTDVTATQGTETSCVRVNWTASAGATEYAVSRASLNDWKNAEFLPPDGGRLVATHFNDRTAIPGVDYWYFIKARNSSGTSKEYSVSAHGWRKLSQPEVTASDDLLDKVSVTWNNVEGATHYRVYRAESIDDEKNPISGWIAASTQDDATFDDTTATAGVTYFYFVVAAVDANGSRPSDFSIVEDGTRAVPVTIDHLEIKGDASVNAGAYADYAADAIYTDGHKVENVTPNNWKIVGDGASVVGCRVTAASVTENKTVTLVATYTEDGKTVTGEKSITIAAVKPVAPHNVAATVAAEGVTLLWGAVAGAASYAIYRDGTAVGRVVPNAPGDVPATTYTDSSAIPGVTYSYTVSAANGAGEGPQSSPAVTATIPLPAPTGVTATTDRTDGVLVDWRRVMDNAPYQNGEYYFRVARATSDNGAKTELGSWTTDTSFLDTSAPVDTPLWYFVRAATSADGANASDWSAGVTGRVVPNAPQLLSIAISGPDKVASSGSAVYSCTAAYDDGTAVSVAPSWSASGAAAIDANGKLIAHAVTADAAVTVTAAFGGKSATKVVKVLAPVQASASVSNVRVTPRWPFSTLVDIDYTLATSPEGTRALVTLSGQDNDHNVPLAAKTLTGDAVGAAITAGDHRLTWDIGADYPGFHTTSFDVNLEAVPYMIAAPANVSASQGTSTRGVNLSWDAVEEATGYEIWRARGSMNTADAVLVTNVEEVVAYEDTAVNPGDIYFYWFKTVTQYGTGDFSASVFGYRARVVGTVAFDANGGTASASSLGYTAGSPYGTLPTASRTGYEFAGWFTSATGGSEVTATTPADENIATLYARWTPHTYTIHFDTNGGTGTMADIEMTYDVATNLAANAFSNNGWVFIGWATSANGEVAYADRARVANLSVSNGATVALFAVWGLGVPSNIRHSTTSTCEESLSSTGVVNVVWHERHSLAWDAAEGAASYKVFRNTANDLSSATLLATVTGTSYEFDGTGKDPAYYYWVVAVKGASSAASDAFSVAESMVSLMPLRNLLTTIEYMNPDGVLADNELNRAINDPTVADMDGNHSVNSPEELYVFTRIKALNTDKQLISDVMRGDYTSIGGSTLLELFELSECVRFLAGGSSSSNFCLFPKRPSNVSATRQNYSTAKVAVSWTGITDAQGYEVWRSATKDFSSGVTKVADVTTTSYTDTNVSYRSPYSYMIRAKYADGTTVFSPTYVYGYWGDWCFSDVNGNGIDLMPLRNVLHNMDRVTGDVDGYVSDAEMNKCMVNPHAADLDGDSSVISSAEMAVFTRIQTLNNDKELIHYVIQGDYTYRGMTLAQMKELQSINDAIKELTKNRNN